jgi:hypothetical protein
MAKDTGRTKLELVNLAHEAGFAATPRLVDDWTAVGLLDRPERQWLGRGKGSRATWPATQAKLFLLELDKRRDVRRVATLCNIPVWLWAQWGDHYVPLPQARRALESWAGARSSTPWAQAVSAARVLSGQLLPGHSRPRERKALIEVLARAQLTGRLDREALQAAVGRLVESAEARRFGPSVDQAGVMEILSVRWHAIEGLSRVEDDVWHAVQLVYQGTRSLRSIDEPEGEAPQRACLDVVTILGFELRARETSR